MTRWEKCWEILSRLKNVQKFSFVALNRVLLIDLSTLFFHFLMDKLRKIRRLHWEDRLWVNNIAKRESDLLKTNEANLPPPNPNPSANPNPPPLPPPLTYKLL